MPAFFRYGTAILGTQSSNGSGTAIDYTTALSGTWQYSGPQTSFTVRENNKNNDDFDGDRPNDQVSTNNQIGRGNAQTVEVSGVDRQVLWDYTFQVQNPTTGDTWNIGVIDVDLNNDNNVNDIVEAGYYLTFIDGAPPPNTVLNIVGIVEDETKTPHLGLGAEVVCFAAGTLIDTDTVPRPVEKLGVGDLIQTRDAGLQPIRWLGITEVAAQGKTAPIVISKGVLGNDKDLVLSPQHAVLLQDWRAELLYGAAEVLIRAVDLLGQKGVFRRVGARITYCHILFDSHQLVRASGMWSESLYPGDMTRQTVNPEARREIETLFPDMKGYGPKSRRCLRGFEAACLAA